MKKIISLFLVLALSLSLIGCINPQKILAAAEAGLKGYEASVQDGSDEYKQAEKIGGELASLNKLYGDAKAAVDAASKEKVSEQIAAVAQSIAADDKQLLSLVGVKNPEKVQIINGTVVAFVEAFVILVQSSYPDPSGNSVQLNSTSGQLKAAVNSAK